MIDIKNGRITFCDISLQLSPKYLKNNFQNEFPENRVVRSRDMGNGYIWYDIKEQIYKNDNSIRISICFNPEGFLEHIKLFPQSYGDPTSSWSDWTPLQMQEDKKLCDEWLKRFCKLKSEKNYFNWGTIYSYFDIKSGCSGIGINYI